MSKFHSFNQAYVISIQPGIRLIECFCGMNPPNSNLTDNCPEECNTNPETWCVKDVSREDIRMRVYDCKYD